MESEDRKSTSPLENGERLTECFICGEIYSDPKMLPCLHTFCLGCLVRHREELQQQHQSTKSHSSSSPDNRIPCPRCQRIFVVPDGGFEALSNNFFFGRLANARRMSTLLSTDSSEDVSEVCAPCASMTPEVGHHQPHHPKREPAKFICFDCDEKLCAECASAHRKQKPSRHHKVEELTSATVFRNDPDKQQDLIQRQSSKCETHPGDDIKLYCHDCSRPVCSQCISETHEHHGLTHITEVASNARTQLEDGIQRVTGRIGAFQKLLASIQSQRSGFVRQMDDAEARICETAEAFVRLVESNKEALLSETESIKRNTLQELEKAAVDVEFGMSTMESFTELATELMDRGTDADVAFMWTKLETRRKQLETMHQDVSVCSVKFVANDVSTVKSNLLGQVRILDIDSSDPYVDTPKVIDIIPGSASVAGVTVLDGELYIVRDLSPNVDIYDAVSSFAPVRRLRLEGLRKPADIVACAQNNSLYVSDSVGHVYRLEPHGEVLTRWQVEGEPQGLHATANGNVFVTCSDSRQVKEFTADGALVRSFRFQQDVLSTWQTIPVVDEGGRFVVCHGFDSGKLHRVCHVDANGRILRVYGSANGSGPNRLDAPLRMAVDPFGYVFVVDRNNDRIQLLSPNLIHVRDLISRISYGIKQPRRIFLDTSTGSLYVGLIDGRVLVFHILDVRDQ